MGTNQTQTKHKPDTNGGKNINRRNIGNEIILGLEEAIRHMRGKKTRAVVHVRNIPGDKRVQHKAENLCFCDAKTILRTFKKRS